MIACIKKCKTGGKNDTKNLKKVNNGMYLVYL